MTRFVAMIALLVPVLWALASQLHAGEEEAAPSVDSLRPFFDEMQRVAGTQDRAAVAALFDVTEIVGYLDREGFLDRLRTDKREGVKSRLRAGLGRSFANNETIWPFESFEIRSIRRGTPTRNLVVYVRHTYDDGIVASFRWFLTPHGDSWRVVDMEDIEAGFGFVALLGAIIVDIAQGGGRSLAQVGGAIRKAQELLVAGEFEDAHDQLVEVEAADAPDMLHAIVQLTLASASLGMGEVEAALDHANQAQELNADIPGLDYLRAVCFNLLDEPAKALRHARKFIAALDEDPMVNLEVGHALFSLGRKAEALVPLRKSLAADPVDYEALAYLALSLPQGKRGEVSAHFDKLEDIDQSFVDIADICVAEGDPATLRHVVALYAAKHAGNHNVPFYRGEAFLLEEKPAEAAVQFAQALVVLQEIDMDPEDQEDYVEAWLDAMIAQEKHLQAFEASRDRAHAFRYLAADLSTAERPAVLEDLVARAGPQEDVLLDRRYFAAEVQFLRRRYADAIEILRPLRVTVNARVPADEVTELSNLLWDIEDRLVRALVRAGGVSLDEALRLAKEISQRDEDWYYLVIVHANRGETSLAVAAMGRAIGDREEAEAIFQDADAAKILASDPYEEARAKYLPER